MISIARSTNGDADDPRVANDDKHLHNDEDNDNVNSHGLPFSFKSPIVTRECREIPSASGDGEIETKNVGGGWMESVETKQTGKHKQTGRWNAQRSLKH